MRSYNSFGSCEKKNKIDPKKLIVLRMQLKNIHSEHANGVNLGSVIFAQSFFIIEPKTSICLTKCVPNSLAWQTDNMHYRNTPLPLDLSQPINCAKLGEMQETSPEVMGFYPVKEEFHQTLQDRILNGKLTFFERGMIFSDMRLGSFVLPYSAIERITTHGATNDRHDWMQFVLNEEGRNLVPLGHVAEPTFYLLVKHDFSNATILKLQKLTDELEMV